MTTHWVHQLPTVGVDKHIIIFPKTWANHYTQSVSWVSVAFLKQREDSDVMLASTQETLLIKKVNSILIQAAKRKMKRKEREGDVHREPSTV